ncbi:MAG: RidA family protein [Geminicoccaceae bacterium]
MILDDTSEGIGMNRRMFRFWPMLALAAVLLFPGYSKAAEIQRYRTEGAKALNLPFSEAVIVGDTIYLSGQIGNLPGKPELAPGGIEGEARQVMANIGAVLEANGSSFAQVVQCTVMLADIADWPAFNDVYVASFEDGAFPARSAFAASGLALGARVEVTCIAVR